MTTVLENLDSLITYRDGDEDRCLGYLMNFAGHGVYDASLGKVEVTPDQADTHNKLLDEALLHGLDERCQIGQHGTFYVGNTTDAPPSRRFWARWFPPTFRSMVNRSRSAARERPSGAG